MLEHLDPSKNLSQSSTVKTITKREFIIREVGILASTILSFQYLNKNTVNNEAYVRALEHLPVENLRKAFSNALKVYGKRTIMPTPMELVELAEYRPEGGRSALADLTPDQIVKKRERIWNEVATRCFLEENKARGYPLAPSKDPVDLMDRPDNWGHAQPDGRVTVRTRGSEYVGYDALRAALLSGEIPNGQGVLFLTLPTGELKWWTVKFADGAVFHAFVDYPDIYPEYGKPLL